MKHFQFLLHHHLHWSYEETTLLLFTFLFSEDIGNDTVFAQAVVFFVVTNKCLHYQYR
jgi:hypothetical protein